jgi:hypothetical protein
MKFYKQFLILLVFVAMSCKKSFLEVPDKTVLVRQAYVTDLKTTQEFLNGIYIEMATTYLEGEFIIYPDIIADDIKPVSGSASYAAHYGWAQLPNLDNSSTLNPTSPNSNGSWYCGYRIIRDCDFIIESVDKYRKEDPEKADDIKGQAYALRALIHFFLVNTFAQPYNFTPEGSHSGIPYITSSEWASGVSRQTVEEVYSNMISDLNKSFALLSANPSDTRFMNVNAAKALLARVYLFKGDYQNAKSVAAELGKKFPIMSVSSGYPDNIYKLLPPSQTESLFQLPPSTTAAPVSGRYSTFFAGYYFNTPVICLATNDIAIILKENLQDARNKWVLQSGTTWNIRKYPLNVDAGYPAPGSRSYYQTILRSSEMFLIASESYAKTGNEDSARYYLDAIRKRANPLAVTSTAVGNALIDSIYKERRKEFCFEGIRMFDLLRTGKGVNRQDAPNPAAKTLPYPSDKAIAPIPNQDVELSGLTQNQGYN